MFHSRLYRKIALVVAAAGFLAVSGCSNQPATEASNQPASQRAKPSSVAPKKAATPKVAAAPAKATPQLITVPKGTVLTATVGQTLASDKNHPGDSFAASLAKPVTVDGKVVLPKGTHVTGRLVTVKKHELKLILASVVIHGKSYDLATNSVRPAPAQEKSSNKKENKDVTTLSAKTQLTFKLSKPVTVPVKG